MKKIHFKNSIAALPRLGIFAVLLTALTLFLIGACRKNLETNQPAETCKGCTPEGEHLFVRSGKSDSEVSSREDETEIGNRKVLLGAKRANPYTVAAMTQAWNSLWPAHQTTALPASHLYVRFRPATLAEYKLLEPSDIPLTTFPLDYEIIQQGDWYDDPAIPNDQIPWFYAVVPAGFQFPAVQYEILERLVLAPMKSELTRRSFLIVSQNSGEVSYRDGCTPCCESWPECTEEEYTYGCDVIIPHCGSHNPPSPNEPPNDIYGDPINHNAGTPGTVILNGCGCRVSTEPRNPGGCINVVDTQLPANGTVGGTPAHLEGVADVKVIWWNGYFEFHTTHTDANGCWQITDQREHGRGYMWIKFKNDRAVIRGLRDHRIWDYALAVSDYIGEINGPVYNNISVVYTPTGGAGSAARLFWFAATCNNALAEFHGYAAADGIATPPAHLDILLSNLPGAASAPMLEKSNADIFLLAQAPLIIYAVLFRPTFPLVPTATIYAPTINALNSFVAIWAPDVAFAYGDNAMRSDVVKQIFYHEFAHAAHFNALNNNAYWIANIAYVILNVIAENNPPYGVRGTPNFERCAIIEGLAEHIGPHYADRQYGLWHSRRDTSDAVTLRRRWVFRLEGFRPDAAGNADLDAFIPNGLFHDFIDNNALNPPGVIDPVVDPIVGFTHANCFNACVTGSPQMLTQVEGNLNAALPPGVTTAMTRAMMASYGY
jgi:hypothetical protein